MQQQYTGADEPVMVTEASCTNAMNSDGPHQPTPKDGTAAYLPRLLLES